MDKVQTIENGIIGTGNIKGAEKFDTVYPVEIPLPSYEYGRSQEKLDFNTQIRNKSSGQTKIGIFTISSTGNISITGLGFTPKLVTINACVNGGNGAIKSFISYDGTNTYGIYDYLTTTGLKSYFESTNIVFISDGSSGSFIQTLATLTSLDSDGFTINVGMKNQTTTCIYIAYG